MRYQQIRSYKKVADAQVNPLRKVIDTYDNIIHNLKNAACGIEEKNYEKRFNYIKNALDDFEKLRLSTNSELDIGSKLEKFYNAMFFELNEVIIKNKSAEHLNGIIQNIILIKDTWLKVEQELFKQLSKENNKIDVDL